MTESLRILIRVKKNGVVKAGVADAIRLPNGLRVIMQAAYMDNVAYEIATQTVDIMDADLAAAPDDHPDYEYSTHLVYDADAPMPPVRVIAAEDVPEQLRFRRLAKPPEPRP